MNPRKENCKDIDLQLLTEIDKQEVVNSVANMIIDNPELTRIIKGWSRINESTRRIIMAAIELG